MQTQETQKMQEIPAPSETERPVIEVGTYPDHFYHEAQATFVVPKEPPRRRIRRSLLSPLSVLFFSSLLMVTLVSFSLGASITAGKTASAQSAAAPQASSSTTTG